MNSDDEGERDRSTDPPTPAQIAVAQGVSSLQDQASGSAGAVRGQDTGDGGRQSRLAVPGSGDEAERVRERSKTRTAVTGLLKKLDAIHKAADPDADDLGWLLRKGETLAAKMIELRLHAPTADAKSNHQEDLEEAIWKGNRLLSHLDKCRDAKVQALANSFTTTTLTPPRPPPRESRAAPYQGLPHLDLPKFDGDPMAWRSFRALFDAAIGTREIPSVQKLSYLLMCVKGDAKSVLQGLPLTAENYPTALKLLADRYGNPTTLITMYADEMMRLPAVRDGDVQGLRRFIDRFTTAHREMKSLISEVSQEVLGSQGASADPLGVQDLLLGPLLCGRLPPEMQLMWTRRSSSPADKFNLEKLLEFAREELAALESLPIQRGTPKPHPRESKRPSPTFVQQTDNARPESHAPNREPHQPCPKGCSDMHSLGRCPIYLKMSVAERAEDVKRMKRCWNCLSGRHFLDSCQSTKGCFHCSKRHHTTLHRDPKDLQTRPAAVNVQLEPDRAPQRGVLQTALVRVTNCRYYARVLLDFGAERSYTTASFLRKVSGVKPIRNVLHRYETFGGSVHEQSVPLVNLELVSRHSSSKWSANLLVLPSLCSPVRGIRAKFLRNINMGDRKLADIPDNDDAIDILLGVDALTQIVVPDMIKKQDGLLMMNTIFGWTISGPIADDSSSNLVATSKVILAQTPALWELEAVGIPSKEGQLCEAVDPNPTLRGDRYEVSLPWTSDERPGLSHAQAVKWLPKLMVGSEKHLKLVEVFEDYNEEGILEASSPIGGNFLPYHVVYTSNKMRVVYNASANPWKGPSLNDLLWAGPNLLANLIGVLVRFRLPRLAVVADIQKAFLMVSVKPADRDFLKILWVDRQGNHRVSRFQRVCFGISPGPWLLLCTLEEHLKSELQNPNNRIDFIQKLRENTYMDDFTNGFDSLEDAIEFRDEAKKLLKGAGMNLHKFKSHPHVMKGWGMDPVEEPFKVLGVSWDPTADTLNLPLQLKPALSKREAVASVASVFDPLGISSPWLIKSKILLQSLWELEVGWDETIPPERAEDWEKLVSEAARQDVTLRVGRQVPMKESSWIEVYADASLNAYAACAYMCTGNTRRLLLAKSRVAPLKPLLTIPRLELMGAFLAVRMSTMVEGMLGRKFATHFFSDSEIVLAWIRGSPKEVFVRNRVRNIRELTTTEQWHFIKGNANPADLATRGIEPQALARSDLWWNGPPDEPLRPSTVVLATNPQPQESDPDPLNFADYGSWSKLLGVVKALLSFKKSPCSDEEAVRAILRYLQSHTEEWDNIEKETYPITSPLWQGQPRYDPELRLIVCLPRTGGEALPWLPQGPVASLLVRHIHFKLGHQNWNTVKGELLRSYWVHHASAFIRKMKCVTCRRFSTRPFTTPEGGLPTFRTTPQRCFQSTGIDHFGPLLLKGSPPQKCWVLLFSCATTRAIHLEMVDGLDTETTARGIQRFAARRGMPTFFLSDNGPSFVVLSRALRKSMKVTWRLIPQGAPWHGGFYERAVGSVKKAARKTIGNACLSRDEFQTLLCVLEDAVNRRPLAEDLTPAHFLYGSAPPPLTQGVFEPPQPADPTKLLRRRQRMSGHLWTRWKNEYLTALRNWRKPKSPGHRPAHVGQIVIVEPDNSWVPRHRWRLAKILELHVGADGEVRSAAIKYGNRITRRPLTKLVPLELDEDNIISK